MMCFQGGGVGHKSTRDATDFFKNDCDRFDLKVLTTVSDSQMEEEETEERVEKNDEEMNELEKEDYGNNLGENSEAES